VYIGKLCTRRGAGRNFRMRLYAKALLNEFKLRLFCAYEKIMAKE
jgi:hypothetical protein